jgi:serine/threonine protein kinase/tetratricopeptide (TPR) repeat protein
VADGTPVDWNTVELRERPADQRLVRHLRLVESIASLHRSIPTAAAADEDDDAYVTHPVPGRDSAALPTPSSGPHWGRLTLLERIGQGTSCEVYRAWDTVLHREVAVKLLHQATGDGAQREAHTRLVEEARRLARLRHEHVVQVYGAEQHDGRVGLWMELVRGESLEQAVQSRGVLGAREAALIGLDVCSALAAVHAAGLLHRDVKAQNVMREERGRIVLMDFGTGEELAGTNRLVGTPLYLAPEIFRGQRASVQSDLYSLGVLLFYLVTAKFPVVAGSMEDLARAHAHRQRQPLRDLRPDVPDAFIRTVERAIDSDPTRRFQSVGELESALRESLDAPPATAWVAAPLMTRTPTPAPRRWFDLRFGLAAGLLTLVIAALIVWTGWPPSVSAEAVDSIAVLPIVDKSSGAPSELSEAMTEQLIATIGMVDSLRTTSLMSTMPFKGSAKPATEIAKLLGVDAVVEAVLTASDAIDGPGKLRLDAKVVTAAGGAPLWQGQVTRRRGDSEALLSDVARMITRAVRAKVSTEEASRLRQVRRTNPAAEEAYLQGRLHLASYGQDAAERAVKSFERALADDPNYSAAHASAAMAYVKLAGFGGMSHGEARSRAQTAIRRAYETGEDLAEAHAADADLKLLYDWDWSGAERELQRSLDLNPGFLYARNVYAQLLAAEHRFDEALQISEESVRMDPQSADALISHGLILYYKRDYQAAEDMSLRAIAMRPGNENALLLRSRVLEAQGRFDEALTLANDARKLSAKPGVALQVVIIRLLALTERLDESKAATAALEKAASDDRTLFRARDRAYIYLAQGRTADALDQFERALDERDPTLVWLSVAPRVDALRKEPRFVAILKKIGLN